MCVHKYMYVSCICTRNVCVYTHNVCVYTQQYVCIHAYCVCICVMCVYIYAKCVYTQQNFTINSWCYILHLHIPHYSRELATQTCQRCRNGFEGHSSLSPNPLSPCALAFVSLSESPAALLTQLEIPITIIQIRNPRNPNRNCNRIRKLRNLRIPNPSCWWYFLCTRNTPAGVPRAAYAK